MSNIDLRNVILFIYKKLHAGHVGKLSDFVSLRAVQELTRSGLTD